MGGKRSTRQRVKSLLHSLSQELRDDYGLSPIESRALVRRIADFIEQLQEDTGALRAPGQIQAVAVAAGQPAGRPLSACVTLPVLLNLIAEEDGELLLLKGSRELRRARLYRMVYEAQAQGGLLSYEDLALLLAVDVSTVRRLVASCRANGLEVPTRGWVADIGPGRSHKARVVELLFRGMQPARISCYSGHALSSVERYLADFARIKELVRRNYSTQAIIRITALSPRTVRDYLTLIERYSTKANQPVFDMLEQRFLPVSSTTNHEEEQFDGNQPKNQS